VDIRGAVAVVTGASAGIGQATARALAEAGADVAVAARRMERLEDLAKELGEGGRRGLPVPCDVTKRRDLTALRDAVEKEFGRADVLVNNAGVPGGGMFADMSIEKIEAITRTNLLSVMWATKLFLPMMLARGRGHVVNVASLAGRYAVPGSSVYSAAKHGVIGFSESLFYELKDQGVLVTAINPGFVATEGFPHTDKDPRMVMTPERVAEAIVDIVRKGKAPEVSVPRWIAPGQAFRVLTPPLYRYGLSRATRAMRGRSGRRSDRHRD
jgi:short-subunit dehydrogenase